MPQRIDARPLALARAMPEDDGILLRLEATDLSVTMIVDRVPELVTLRNLEITMSMDDLLAEIADAVQTTVSFQTNRPENKALPPETSLFLFGAHPQVDETMAVSIGEITNRVVRLPASPREAPPDFPALEYMVNVGLALKGPG